MKPASIIFLSLAAVCMACGSSGCLSYDPTTGYTTASPYPSNIRTVYVPLWTRAQEVYRRENEIRLTEALIKRIEQDTPYKVTTRQRADSELTGTIDTISQQTLSFNPDTGNPREIQVTFSVSFQWTDLRSGDVICEHKQFRVADVYLPDNPYNEDFFLGSESLMDKLARRIVEQMESPWTAEF